MTQTLENIDGRIVETILDDGLIIVKLESGWCLGGDWGEHKFVCHSYAQLLRDATRIEPCQCGNCREDSLRAYHEERMAE